jgi:hypothetical protein
MTSARSERAKVTMLTALMKTGRRSALRARAAIHVAPVSIGGLGRRRTERRRGLMRDGEM